MLRTVYQHSRIRALIRNTQQGVTNAVRESTVLSAVIGSAQMGTESTDGQRENEFLAASNVATLFDTVWHFCTQSHLYRRLTSSPDSNTIVIDLRETWSIGPVIGLLNRLRNPIKSASETAFISRLCRLITTMLASRKEDSDQTE